MTDNEKLIEEARDRVAKLADAVPPTQRARILAGDVEDERTSLIIRLADALEAAENAHTPTDDERADAAQRWPIPMNYEAGDSEHTLLIAQRQAYMLGRSDARTRSEVPEPSDPEGEGSSPWKEIQAAKDLLAEAYGPGEWSSEPQGEPSDAQVAEIEQRVYDQHRGQIAGMAKALVRAGWDAAVEGQR